MLHGVIDDIENIDLFELLKVAKIGHPESPTFVFERRFLSFFAYIQNYLLERFLKKLDLKIQVFKT